MGKVVGFRFYVFAPEGLMKNSEMENLEGRTWWFEKEDRKRGFQRFDIYLHRNNEVTNMSLATAAWTTTI